MPESLRSLLDAPVRLAELTDLDELRLQLTARQVKISQAPGSRGGNSSKRIRLRLEVPGFGPHDAERLAAALYREIAA